MKPDSTKGAAGCCGCLGLLGIVAAIGVAAAILTSEPVDTSVEIPATADEAAEKCLSAWDGSHRETNELIKDELVSPDSFEHVETLYRTTLTQGGRILVLTVEFSADNAYGARLRGTGFGEVDVQTCRVVRGGVISGG